MVFPPSRFAPGPEVPPQLVVEGSVPTLQPFHFSIHPLHGSPQTLSGDS